MLLFICGDIEVNPGPRKQLIISHSNVRSLYVNNSDIRISKLHLMARNNSIDILSLTETWLDHSVADCLVSIPGYQPPFRRDRQVGVVGWLYIGVAIYCADHISARRRHDLEDDYN